VSLSDFAGEPLSLREFERFVEELRAQPPWRAQADRCADYADGNQLDSAVLQRQKELGIPPAKENVIARAVRAVCGYEAKSRTDWRVSADSADAGDEDAQEVADALNFELNQAERHSRADRALGAAFRSALVAGVGWVEVMRSPSSLQFPMQCRAVHRNEIFWDMAAQEPDLRDARWLMRRRWVAVEQAAQLFPNARAILEGGVGVGFEGDAAGQDGGVSTGLQFAQDARRAWTRAEDVFLNRQNNQVCISEVWFRRFVKVQVLVAGVGVARQAVVFEPDNAEHVALLQSGQARLREELQSRVRRAYWMGPHVLSDEPSPYAHGRFPYVPVFGWREDMTGIPYGIVRDMVFLQDSLNAAKSRLQWGMTAVQVIRTENAVNMTDEQLRRCVAMPSADIVLNAAEMQSGGKFEVSRDFPLNAQHFEMMQDARRAMQEVSGVSAAFHGVGGSASSGLQEQTQVEQSQMALAEFFDNFKAARSEVGELLLAMIIEDVAEQEYSVTIAGNVFEPPRRVVLNKMEADPMSGRMRRRMDVQKVRLRVALEDVPTSSSFRAQQLASLTEVIKSAPPAVQLALLPFQFELMPIPHKKEVTDLLREASAQPEPEALKVEALEEAKAQLQFELRERELALRAQQLAQQAKLDEAKIAKLVQEAVQTGVQAAYASVQAAQQIVQRPQLAPIADSVLQSANYQKPDLPTDVPDLGVVNPNVPAILDNDVVQELSVRQNTSPAFPPVPQSPDSPLRGIETATHADNL